MSRLTHTMESPAAARLRIDKWLWAARFFKTRGLAQEAIEAGRVRILSERIKPSREVRLHDVLQLRLGDFDWVVQVRALSDKRGPAPVARLLYEETPESLTTRLALIATKSEHAEPSSSIKGRPTKKDRRQIHRFLE